MDNETLVRTRRALHAVAESVLAGPQYRTTGTIRLRVHPGGFATRTRPHLSVVGAELLVSGRRLALQRTTCAALGAAVGVTAGPPVGLYSGGSGVGLDDELDADPEAARWIADCFALGDAALRALFPKADPVLWPEHFDLGITDCAVNYGLSPGDDHIAEPYAYVGPHTLRAGPFWNAPFGAARTVRELVDQAGVRAFFQEGRNEGARL